MVSSVLLFILCMNSISITQEISHIDLLVSGNISSFEVSEFSYEGVIVVDVKGNILPVASLERFVNSPLKEVEIKKRGPGDFRLIFKFNGPVKLIDKEISKRGLKIRVSPETQDIQVLTGSPSSGVPRGVGESQVKVVKETLYVEKPIPFLLKCSGVTGAELSAFLQSATGLKLNLKSDSVYDLFLRVGSKEEFLRKLSGDGR